MQGEAQNICLQRERKSYKISFYQQALLAGDNIVKCFKCRFPQFLPEIHPLLNHKAALYVIHPTLLDLQLLSPPKKSEGTIK